jgi:hypothetical protein
MSGGSGWLEFEEGGRSELKLEKRSGGWGWYLPLGWGGGGAGAEEAAEEKEDEAGLESCLIIPYRR